MTVVMQQEDSIVPPGKGAARVHRFRHSQEKFTQTGHRGTQTDKPRTTPSAHSHTTVGHR